MSTAPVFLSPHVLVGSTNGWLRAFVMDMESGALTPAGAIETAPGLDFIVLGPDDRTVFVTGDGSVSAYAYDPQDRTFVGLDQRTTCGSGTHANVDATGEHVFVVHYDEGILSWLRYRNGKFEGVVELEPGRNPHQIHIDGASQKIYIPCLGSHYVAQYDLDVERGALSPSAIATVAAEGGPRHMDVHAELSVAYVLSELSSEIHVYDLTEGSWVPRPGDSIHTAADGAYHWSSDLRVLPNGRFVYAVNRAPPEIVGFAVASDGRLTRSGAYALTAPVRSFAVDAEGRYLLVGGEDGVLVSLAVDPETGTLRRSAASTGLGNIRATVVRGLTHHP